MAAPLAVRRSLMRSRVFEPFLRPSRPTRNGNRSSLISSPIDKRAVGVIERRMGTPGSSAPFASFVSAIDFFLFFYLHFMTSALKFSEKNLMVSSFFTLVLLGIFLLAIRLRFILYPGFCMVIHISIPNIPIFGSYF